MQRYPIAYLRRSSADANNPGDVSLEAQQAAVRELAHRDGYNGEVRILTDWDRSADDAKEGRRAGFLAMLAAIERGEVDVVYAASLDRLYRSPRTFFRLTDATKAHGTRIVTLREGVLGGDGSPMAQAFAEITAVFSGLELRTTKARAAVAMAARRERGDLIGRCGYGFLLARNAAGAIVAVPDPDHPLEPIIGAVREAGSILGGCKLLMARGVPAPDGGTVWGNTTLRRIIEHNAPNLLPKAGPSGRRTPTHSRFAQLLVCHCGHILTPNPGRKTYRCAYGRRVGAAAHGLTYLSEAAVLPWIVAEIAHTDLGGDRAAAAAEDEAQRVTLAGRLERASEEYVAGRWTRERRDREIATVAAERDKLGSRVVVADLGNLDELWTWAPADANSVLRAILERVELGPDMRPVSATWRNPALRRACDDPACTHCPARS